MSTHARSWDLWAVQGVTLLILSACMPQTHQPALSDSSVDSPAPEPRRRELMVDFRPPEPTGPVMPEVVVSIHSPYAQRQCGECHISGSGQASIPPAQGLCLRCHQDRMTLEGWDHGPLNFGLCLVCHVPHASQYPHLEARPQPDLCLGCHSDPTLLTSVPAHAGGAGQRCTACHDPHRT